MKEKNYKTGIQIYVDTKKSFSVDGRPINIVSHPEFLNFIHFPVLYASHVYLEAL